MSGIAELVSGVQPVNQPAKQALPSAGATPERPHIRHHVADPEAIGILDLGLKTMDISLHGGSMYSCHREFLENSLCSHRTAEGGSKPPVLA